MQDLCTVQMHAEMHGSAECQQLARTASMSVATLQVSQVSEALDFAQFFFAVCQSAKGSE